MPDLPRPSEPCGPPAAGPGRQRPPLSYYADQDEVQCAGESIVLPEEDAILQGAMGPDSPWEYFYRVLGFCKCLEERGGRHRLLLIFSPVSLVTGIPPSSVVLDLCTAWFRTLGREDLKKTFVCSAVLNEFHFFFFYLSK
ncbi:hypothetical protein GDO81_020862 [Engystomops pustulosus]|uniref:Uncharacterized protein n=1 Tax=Engystomops pustulosus TaxID=76066 RepID=A0AAV6YWB1_ENGPU|nr:hypothetical protein GDO81_020862 [Engystomops pustulosus]